MGRTEAPAFARLSLAATRGLLFDLLLTGDRKACQGRPAGVPLARTYGAAVTAAGRP